MLSLDSPRELHRVVLYRDHANPKLYYYMPASPRIARNEDGSPAMRLLVYRRDVTDNPAFSEGDSPGGGFLDLTVDLAVPISTRNRIKEELGGDDIDLVALPVESGSVRIATLGVGDPARDEGADPSMFVERVLGATQPSLYGDNRATFAIQLTAEGALLMEAALTRGGASPVSVIYSLRFRGLMPAYRANITIDFQQTYKHLRNKFQANTLVFKTDLDQEMETLVRNEAIVIEQEDFTGMSGEQQAAERERLEALARDLAAGSFFTPSLRPGEVLAVDRGSLSVYDPTEDARVHTAGFTSPLTTTLLEGAEASVRGRSDATGGLGGMQVGGGGGSDSSSAGEAEAEAPVARTDREPTAVERWNQAGRPQAGYLLRSLEQRELRRVTFETKQTSAVVRDIAPQGTIAVLTTDAERGALVQRIDLSSPFFESIRGSVSTTARFDALHLRSLVVKLRYGQRDDGTGPKDTAEHVLERNDQTETFRFMMDHRKTQVLEYQTVLNYAPDGMLGEAAPTVESSWVPTTSRHLQLHPSEVDPVFLARVETGLIDWEMVRRVQCRVVYDDTDRGGAHSVLLDSSAPSFTVPVRPGTAGSRQWHVETEWSYADGTSRSLRSADREGDDMVVLDAFPAGMARFRLELLDPLRRYRKVSVELRCEREGGALEHHVELSASQTSAQWAVPRTGPDDVPQLEYKAVGFLADGTVQEGGTQRTTDSLLLLGDVFTAGFVDVEVRMMVDDFAAEDLKAVRLRVEVPGAAPGVDGTLERVWVAPDSEPWRLHVPRAPGGSGAYRYSVTWIRRSGGMERGDPVEATDETLFVHPALM